MTGVEQHMNPFLRSMSLLLAVFSMPAIGDQVTPSSVESVLASRPCRPAYVAVFGYLHASRHGSWISDDAGTNGNGLPIQIAEFDSPERKRLLSYIYRPQENMRNMFSAVFTGITSCNENGVSVLHVLKIEHIVLTPIKDA